MGRIKSTLVKRASSELIKLNIPFTNSFDENKRFLNRTMPSKKIRNKIAGYIARLKKVENAKNQ